MLEGLITRSEIADIALSEHLVLDDEDRISVLETMRSIDVQACPGSGKTTLIAAKLILLAKKWPFRHQGVCVLSHTNVAKDEIVDRLKRSNTIEAQRLLSYPHFIGTIQEFVGKFVALPLIRSAGISINLVDTDTCVNLIYSKLPVRTRTYIDKKSQYSNVLYDFDLAYADGKISLNVPTFPNGSTSQAYRDLLSVRKKLIKGGYFFYRDIFSFALMALRENAGLPSILRQRFPCVFLDEMQDTQKFQDDLLREIFSLGDPSHIVQRFGDPDQAIFHGIGNEEPNESFNGKSQAEMDFVIHKSHRFDGILADKVKPLSLNEIPLETELSAEALSDRFKTHASGGDFEHTIVVFNNETLIDVITCFAQIVSHQFTDQYKRSPGFSAKVVGAVGNVIDPTKDQLKIGHYWPSYDKTKAKTKFEETSLLEAVRYCRQSSSIDWAEKYKFLVDRILKLLRTARKLDGNGQYFSSSTLRDSLKDRMEWDNFRKCIHLMLSDTVEIDQQFWEDTCALLTRLLELGQIPSQAIEYLAFSEEPTPVGVANGEQHQEGVFVTSSPDNKIKHPYGFEIELSTIHGVKGETHDATLVVETKNYTFDLEKMLPYLTGELPSASVPNSQMKEIPNSRRANKVFMRQFYVAMSRPRHLLCLALHSDRISEDYKELLMEKGWKVEVLVPHTAGST